jgi:hypothetical protein
LSKIPRHLTERCAREERPLDISFVIAAAKLILGVPTQTLHAVGRIPLLFSALDIPLAVRVWASHRAGAFHSRHRVKARCCCAPEIKGASYRALPNRKGSGEVELCQSPSSLVLTFGGKSRLPRVKTKQRSRVPSVDTNRGAFQAHCYDCECRGR